MTRSLASASAPGASPEIETLRRILRRLDSCEQAAFNFEDVRRWPKGQLDRFLQLGLIRKGGMAGSTIYYDCEEHCGIDYDRQTLPNGRVVITHRCMYGCGLAVLEPEWFQLWDIRFDGLVRWVGEQIGLVGDYTPVVVDRITLLGGIELGGSAFEVFVARGLRRADAASILARADRLRASAAPLVLVPSDIPPPEFWSKPMPTIASLKELLVGTGEFPRVDVNQLMLATRLTAATDQSPADEGGVPLLTQIEVDLLQALARSPHEAMLQVEISAAAGYSKSATRDGLNRLRELEFVAKPPGKRRKGDAITARGRAFLKHRGAADTSKRA